MPSEFIGGAREKEARFYSPGPEGGQHHRLVLAAALHPHGARALSVLEERAHRGEVEDLQRQFGGVPLAPARDPGPAHEGERHVPKNKPPLLQSTTGPKLLETRYVGMRCTPLGNRQRCLP